MSQHAFPFVGAGVASYFEWAEMFVAFVRPPTAAEAATIAERVPAPLRDRIAWSDRVLGIASEQGVGRVIAAAYASPPRAPASLTTANRHAIASDAAYARFEADIDGFLHAVHAVVPILVAFRRQDHEAGGTELSAWHHESAAQLPRILDALAGTEDAQVAALGARLVAAAKEGGLEVDATLARRFAVIVEAAEADEATARKRAWEARLSRAAESLGAPMPPYDVVRADLVLGAAADLLPATSRRLARLAKKGLAIRPPATPASIAAVEAALGVALAAEHRALLTAFDGGRIADVTFLGTAGGGARGDAEIATFSRAWCGEALRWVVIARSGWEDVVVLPAGKSSPAYLLHGRLGGGGSTTRQCKSLDVALDLVLKRGEVWNNLAT